ncbi:MAG: hypothetical protein ACRD07_08865 [Acidimicrobiales bacterium]
MKIVGTDAPEVERGLDARRIAERASGYHGAQLLLHLDDLCGPGRALRPGLVERRSRGKPLQYVLGRVGIPAARAADRPAC